VELASLRESIKTTVILQPLGLCVRLTTDGYQLIAGERRLRAAGSPVWRRAVRVVDFNDKQVLEEALVEKTTAPTSTHRAAHGFKE